MTQFHPGGTGEVADRDNFMENIASKYTQLRIVQSCFLPAAINVKARGKMEFLHYDQFSEDTKALDLKTE